VPIAHLLLTAMADQQQPGGNLPPPPGGAPGYDGHQGVPQQHMPPPPLAPVVIPQNTNPIPTAMGSPLPGNPGLDGMSPGSGGPGYVPRRAAPEPNKRALYVGGLDPRVTEDVLRQIFETTGHVQSVKIIPDKTVSSPSVRQNSSRAAVIYLCHVTQSGSVFH
jgi:nucleolysin TIA-1/TIAR